MLKPPPIASDKDSEALSQHICDSIDLWHKCHPDLSVAQILRSLERIRFAVTEAWLNGERE